MRTLIVGAFAALFLAAPALAQQWGDVKGQVIWTGGPLMPEFAKVDKDQAHCLAKGQLPKGDLVVDSKTMGVKDVLVWLAPLVDGGKVPIHPSMQAVPAEPHVIDQPQCAFEPRVSALRAGQKLIVKNSAPVAHNARISGRPAGNGTINLTIPPGAQIERTLKAEPRPLLLACDIHGWMAGRIGVFDHPYFAVTKDDGTFELKNAPAGNFLLYVQHERAGWLHTPRGSKGQPITIKPGGKLELKFELKKEFLN